MLPVGFEPTISAGERPKTYALDRAATGTGSLNVLHSVILRSFCWLVNYCRIIATRMNMKTTALQGFIWDGANGNFLTRSVN